MSKHTLGPWENRGADILSNQGMVVAYAYRFPAETPNATDKANARLIAAAPDLLAEMRGLAAIAAGVLAGEINPAMLDWDYILKQARAVIGKATEE